MAVVERKQLNQKIILVERTITPEGFLSPGTVLELHSKTTMFYYCYINDSIASIFINSAVPYFYVNDVIINNKNQKGIILKQLTNEIYIVQYMENGKQVVRARDCRLEENHCVAHQFKLTIKGNRT